jgi:hypothetical protein
MVLVGVLAVPCTSVASTTFGSDLSPTPNVGIAVVNVNTVMNSALPNGAPHVASPITGTIIRWRIKTGTMSNVGSVTFRVIASPSAAMFMGAGTGDTETLPSSTTSTFSTDLPILAGDYIAVNMPAGGRLNAFASSQTGANLAFFRPPLADGGTAASPAANDANYELLLNADVAALPTSSVTVPACSRTGHLAATVTSDPDPAVAPKAIHFRIDGGSQHAPPTTGNPGSATIPVPQGSHTVAYWGEDTVGGLESSHHTARVLVDSTAPVVSITSDQGKTTYARGEVASISVAASDPGSGLRTDPSGAGELLPTSVPGTFTVNRTAVDRCGNSTTRSFTFTVVNPTTTTPTPQLTSVSQSQRRWRLGRALARFAVAAKPPVGTMFRFTLNEAATVRFAFAQLLPGRKAGSVCVAQSAANRNHKACTRSVPRGSLSFSAGAGLHRLFFQGRLTRTNKLKPGTHALTITATNAAGRKATKTLAPFTIVRQ